MILATRPVLLHIFRTYRDSWRQPPDQPRPRVSETALALAEACIRCSRHSYRLLTESWINGFFGTFGYTDTQYLFSAATILAISSLLNTPDSQNDGDQFETATDLLRQLERVGNFAAKEFCKHVDAMKAVMEAFSGDGQSHADEASTTIRASVMPNVFQDIGPSANAGSMVTAGMALAEPSLQEFLSQPDLEYPFIDSLIQGDGLQSLYWPSEGWMTG